MSIKSPSPIWLPDELGIEAEKMVSAARTLYPHRSGRGDRREQVLRDFLDRRLPQSVDATKGHITDCEGRITPEFDIILFNPMARLVISHGDETRKVLPVESVYAVIEVRTNLDRQGVRDAVEKMKALATLTRFYRPTIVADYLGIDSAQIRAGHPATQASFILPIIGYLFGYEGASYETICDEMTRHPSVLECAVNLQNYIVFHHNLSHNGRCSSPKIALSIFLLSIVGHLMNSAAMNAFQVPNLERYWD